MRLTLREDAAPSLAGVTWLLIVALSAEYTDGDHVLAGLTVATFAAALPVVGVFVVTAWANRAGFGAVERTVIALSTAVVMGLGTVFNALPNRRDPTSGLTAPILQALAISSVPVALIILATQLPGLQAGLLTTSLTGLQWLECLGLAVVLPIVIELTKWIRRRRAPSASVLDAPQVVAPDRAASDVIS
jgi:hypothetical protein